MTEENKEELTIESVKRSAHEALDSADHFILLTPEAGSDGVFQSSVADPQFWCDSTLAMLLQLGPELVDSVITAYNGILDEAVAQHKDDALAQHKDDALAQHKDDALAQHKNISDSDAIN